MDMDFAVSCPLVRCWRLVSGFCPSTRTFAIRFLQTPPRGGSPCVLASPSPPSGWAEDFHLQAAEHAQHTTKPQAADASRDIIWQGTCHVAEKQLRNVSAGSNSPPLRITISIEYPISNCPAKFGRLPSYDFIESAWRSTLTSSPTSSRLALPDKDLASLRKKGSDRLY